MKIPVLTIFVIHVAICVSAQVGVGTTSPNSTLDVRGSMSNNLRTFTASTSASTTDYHLIFTGTSAATITLPDASTITGRAYVIKNASSNASVLTIATTSSQTIDGVTSWPLSQTNKSITVISNGTNWYATSESLPGNSTLTSWLHGGNNVSSLQNLGTTSNYDLPFITNNTEKMRLSSTGNVGIGTSSFNGTFPEKLVVDAGTTTSVNAIVGKGTINNYLQLNIQNLSNGTNSSSDVVATADNGNETSNYVDMGINGSGNTSGIMGSANDAYLYNIGQNLLIGTGSSSKSLIFMTGGTVQASNERMRISGTGSVGINTNSPGSTLDVNGSQGRPITVTSSNITLNDTHYTVILSSGSSPTVTLPAASSCPRRIYIIVNQTSGSRTISSYKNYSNANTTTVATVSSITLQSDGTNWYRIG